MSFFDWVMMVHDTLKLSTCAWLLMWVEQVWLLSQVFNILTGLPNTQLGFWTKCSTYQLFGMLKKETNLASEPSVQHTNCCLTLLWSASAIMHPVEMLLHKIYTLRYIALLYSTCLLTAMGCYALNILMSSAWVSEHKQHCINVIGNIYHILLCPFLVMLSVLS